MIKSFICIIMLAYGIAATGIINLSKDSLKICNNPLSSFYDEGVVVTNNSPMILYLDSAFIIIDEMDTTGSGMYGLNGRLQAFWRGHLETPEQYFWNLEKIDGNKYRMIRWNSTPADTQPVRFTAQLRINGLEIGTCLGCSGVPTWYPPFFKGSLILYLSNGYIVNIRLYSDDLRKYNQPCADYACDSMNVRKILDRNGMASVPVGSFTSVTNGRIVTLRLSYNLDAAVSLPEKLTILPPEIGNLTALKSLDVSGNALDSLPQRIGRCLNLESIVADNNRMVALPDSIVSCTRLRSLLLDNNRLGRLPDSIGNLRSLTSLSIACNLLPSLPRSVAKLDSLRCLFISGNRICTIPDEVIAWMANVQTNRNCTRPEPVWPDSQKCDTVSAERGAADPQQPAFGIRSIVREGGFIKVEFSLKRDAVIKIEVFDFSGKRVEMLNPSIDCRAAETIRLNAHRYSTGWYFLRVTSGTTHAIGHSFVIER